MRAGAAQTNISPLIGVSLAGGFHDRKAVDIRDELHAKAIVLDDGETRVAFVICDLICLPRETVQAAREIIETTCGIPRPNILIAATHTHYAPSPTGLLGTPRADDYMDALPPKIADSVRRACARMMPAKWGVALGSESRLSFNRRFRLKDGSVVMNPGYDNPNVVETVGPVDRDVAVLHVVHAETGRSLGLLANFALHYVGGNPGNVVSADYFALFGEAIRKWRGESFVVALANGFCGDVNNINVRQPSLYPRGWEQAENVARILASNVLGLMETMTYSAEGKLRVAGEELTIPLRPITPEKVANARAILGTRSHHDPADGYSRDELFSRELLYLNEMPPEITTETQAIALDGVGFAACGGEIFAQFGLNLSEASPLKPLFKIELANDYIGYVPTRKAFMEGLPTEQGRSYETWFARSSKLNPEAGDRLMDSLLDLLQTVATP